MASLHEMALPGRIPTAGSGRNMITPESLFKSDAERAEYQNILNSTGTGPQFKVKKVNVRIFDLSDGDQVAEYEKLWKELLEKSGRMEVIVDSRKDLVHRKDGTSYWMKYVEYVEFGDAKEEHGSSEGSDR